MGIRSLQSYLEINPNIYYKIDILEIIPHLPKQRRTVVLDGNSSIKHLYGGSRIDIISQGQYQEFREKIREFIKYFTKHDIKITVFFDCSIIPNKREMWVCNEYEKQEKTMKFLDDLDNGQEINLKYVLRPDSLKWVAINEFRRYSKVILLHDREMFNSILEYANEFQCFAILANNPDFALSIGEWNFWSMKDFDFKSNTVYVYDTNEIARYFNLTKEQLPLLATLMGNEVITSEMLKIWHHKMLKSRLFTSSIDRYKLFHEIATYVRYFKNKLTIENCNKISLDCFNRSDYGEEILKKYETYFGEPRCNEQYKNGSNEHDAKWKAILLQAKLLNRHCRMSSALLNVLFNNVYNKGASVEDHRKSDLPLGGDLYSALRARIYGLIFTDYEKETRKIQEWILTYPGSLSEPILTKPVEHNFNFDLSDMWSGYLSRRNMRLCWHILCLTIHKDLYQLDIRSLPIYLIPSLLTLIYMQESCGLRMKDFENFLIVAVACNKEYLAVNLIDKSEVRIKSKYLRLGSLYMYGVRLVKMLSVVCGMVIDYEYFDPANLYDGILYQFVCDGGVIEKYKDDEDFLMCMSYVERFLMNSPRSFETDGSSD